MLSSFYASSTQMTSTALPVYTLSTFSFFFLMQIIQGNLKKKTHTHTKKTKKPHKLQIYQASSLLSILQWLPIHWGEVQIPYHTSTRSCYFMDLACTCSLQPQRTCYFSNMLSTLLLQACYICCFLCPGTFSTLIAPWLIPSSYSGLCSDVLFS